MANKTSSTTKKKTGKQINNSESKTTVKKTTTKKSTTTKKTTTKKTTTREKVVVAPEKKKTPAKKTTTAKKNVRTDVVVNPTKKSTTKTIDQEKIKNDLQSKKNKKETVQVVVPRSKKKDLASEVNKILEIESTPKKEVVEAPKFIQEEKPTLPEYEIKEDLQTKVKDFLEKEDLKEIEKPSTTSLDEVDVIKFEKKKPPIKSKNTHLKKKTSLKSKPVDIEQIDKIHEYDIVEEIKKDVSKKEAKQPEFTRKRKGKGYVVDIKKKQSYKELEDDLRSLYDTVSDVVDDFDNTATLDVVETPKKKKISIFGKKKKPISKKPVVQKITPGKKTKVIKETVIADVDSGVRPSFLDRISQRVLNKFLVFLLIVFSIMMVAFILFVIYVSTF